MKSSWSLDEMIHFQLYLRVCDEQYCQFSYQDYQAEKLLKAVKLTVKQPLSLIVVLSVSSLNISVQSDGSFSFFITQVYRRNSIILHRFTS